MQTSIDASANLICSNPNIWVFDDLLSAAFLDHVDSLFDSRKLHKSVTHNGGREQRSSSAAIDIDQDSENLLAAIRAVCQLSEVEPCRKILISDVVGEVQTPHIDHVSIDDLGHTYEKLDFLDLSKQSISKKNSRKIVPTYSIVVYFNAVGGVRFPDAQMSTDTICGKRGRIIMFQNYVDDHRPACNPKSTHYGYYFDNIPKRVITMGILANETPAMSTGKPNSNKGTAGVIYCPGVLDEPLRHDNPAYWPMGHAEEPTFPSPRKKDDFLVTIQISEKEGEKDKVMIQCLGLSGDVLAEVEAGKSWRLRKVRKEIESKVDPTSDKCVQLATTDGSLLTTAMNDDRLDDMFQMLNVSLKAIKESFARADVNKDGYLSGAELRALFAGIKLLSPDINMTDEDLDTLFPQVDADKDDRLNVDEFVEWLLGVRKVTGLDLAPAS